MKNIRLTATSLFLVTGLTSCSKRESHSAPKEEETVPAQKQLSTEISTLTVTPQNPKAALPIPDSIKPGPTDDDTKRTVKAFLLELRKTPDLMKFAIAEWNNHWLPAFDEPLQKAEDAPGRALQRYSDSQIPSLALAFSKSQEDWMQEGDNRKSAIILMAIFSAFVERNALNGEGASLAGDLPLLIGKHRDRMPPASGDFLLLRVAGEVKILWEHFPKLTDAQSANWMTLSKAKNPFYRMIALDLFRKFDSTPEQAKLFYGSFLQESEVGILKRLRKDLTNRDGEWIQSILAETEAKLGSP